MDFLPITTEPGDPAWIAIAFVTGLLARQGGLPPMVGYLAAGFLLNFFGVTGGTFLSQAADFGITLMLFTIGLKLDLRSLFKPEIYAVATIHMSLTILAFSLIGFIFSMIGVLLYAETDLVGVMVIGFALSFSSTVFAVKVLDQKGAMASSYGKAAIGVLILQDIAAVIFLVFTADKIPSVWALTLFALIPLRRFLDLMLRWSDHGELTILFGIAAALGGAALFEIVDLKGDLGALVFGILLSNSIKAEELSKALLSFKDLFLVCFFLTIGLSGLPNLEILAQSLILLLLLPAKLILFLWLFLGFRMRARGAVASSFILSNYSEFGLIVAAIAAKTGMVSLDWVVALAVAVAVSFVIAAALNQRADGFYQRFRARLRKWQRDHHLPHDTPVRLEDVKVLVFGLGRTGTPAFFALNEAFDGEVLGIDMEQDVVERFTASSARAMVGDATNPEFWSRIVGLEGKVELVLLSMPNKDSNLAAAERLRERGYTGMIAATALYPDDVEDLRAVGIDDIFNLYAAAGEGLAQYLTDLVLEHEQEVAAQQADLPGLDAAISPAKR